MTKLINPYLALIVVIAIGLAYLSGKSEGYKNGFNQAKNDSLTAQQQAVARAIEQTNQINQQNDQIAQAYWQEQIQTKPKIQTIEKRIIQYVETAKPGVCDIDDGELHILTDLTNLVNGTATNKNWPGLVS